MRTHPILMAGLLVAAAMSATGCKKKGGGGWLVGDNGLMERVDANGRSAGGYPLDGAGDLDAIVCAEGGTAFVVGAGGTFLHTADGGDSWTAGALGTTGALREVAAGIDGVVIVAAADGLYRSDDAGAHWRTLAAGGWRSVAIDPAAEHTFALDDAGQLWRGDAAAALAPVTGVAGGVTIAMAESGSPLWLVGADTAWHSADGDRWTPTALGTSLELRDASASEDGALVAVGSAGAIVRISPSRVVTTMTPTSASLDAVHLDDDGIGFAGGEAGILLGTDDGGESWRILDHAGARIRGLDQVGDDGKL